MRVVIYYRNNKWQYDTDSLAEQMSEEDLQFELEYYQDEHGRIVEIPDLPDPNTLA